MIYKIDSKTILLLIWSCTPSLGLDNGLITQEEFCYEDKSCGPESDDWGGQCQTGLFVCLKYSRRQGLKA